MEKRKVFKISIIDKEISRTEFDRNTFYTSDSELSLVFKLIEKDYAYDHGEILLYNENDKSFVTRKITKKEDDFVYELDDDIILYYGTWKAQLQLIKNGDVYTSKPFDFSIVNDLSNLAPQPTLTDINNWATLKQSANELIDEMQVIIVDVERAELERENKENIRQQDELERENKESVRQNSENKRINQENTRQNGELERKSNEKKRQITELERVKKENTRQNDEKERENNEKLRQQAELERENDINIIKDDLLNIYNVNLINKIKNGDFRNGLNNWTRNNEAILTITEEGCEINSTKNGLQIYQSLKVPIGDVLYTAALIKSDTPGNYIISTNQTGVSMNKDDKDFQFLSVITKRAYFSSISINAVNIDTEPAKAVLKYIIAINLTEIFGSSNEPSKAVIDRAIQNNGYFEELTLKYNDIQQYEINQLRKAVLALGGTI